MLVFSPYISSQSCGFCIRCLKEHFSSTAGKKLSQSIIREKLAACVNILPGSNLILTSLLFLFIWMTYEHNAHKNVLAYFDCLFSLYERCSVRIK
jgi:hypothetical protein